MRVRVGRSDELGDGESLFEGTSLCERWRDVVGLTAGFMSRRFSGIGAGDPDSALLPLPLSCGSGDGVMVAFPVVFLVASLALVGARDSILGPK